MCNLFYVIFSKFSTRLSLRSPVFVCFTKRSRSSVELDELEWEQCTRMIPLSYSHPSSAAIPLHRVRSAEVAWPSSSQHVQAYCSMKELFGDASSTTYYALLFGIWWRKSMQNFLDAVSLWFLNYGTLENIKSLNVTQYCGRAYLESPSKMAD